jgi:hypothetical protein
MRSARIQLAYRIILTMALALPGISWAAQAVEDSANTQVITSDPLTITVSELGRPGVDLKQGSTFKTQYYDGSQSYNKDSWGSVIWLDDTAYSTGYEHKESVKTPKPDAAEFVTAVSNTSKTVDNLYVIETIVNLGTAAQLKQTIEYVEGTRYNKRTWELTNTSGSTINDIDFHHGGDTIFGGIDDARSFHDIDRNMIYIMNQSFAEVGYMALYADSTSPNDHYFSGVFGQKVTSDKEWANKFPKEHSNLSDTADAAYKDAGMYLQWKKSSLGATETWKISAYEYYSPGGAIQIFPPQQAKGPKGGSVDLVLKLKNLAPSTNSALVSTATFLLVGRLPLVMAMLPVMLCL